jgi:MFS transporter, ACS family, solute carrier family 17 (sodium-dependent inorganic phosphate cotransporter), other
VSALEYLDLITKLRNSFSSDKNEQFLVDSTPFFKRRRYFVVIMAFFGLFNAFALQINLSVAMVAMTANKAVEHEDGTVTHEREFDWSSKQRGFVVSSFFYGYLVTQLFGGVIARKMGGHATFAAGIGVTAVLNLLTPIAAAWSIYALIAVRVIEGLSEVIKFIHANS